MLQRLLPLARTHARWRPRTDAPSEDAVRVRWLGTAGHVVQTATTTVLLDPFLTRPGIRRMIARPLRSTPDAWARWVPEKVDAVCCGHSHYDHLLDAPGIALRTGATLIGSGTTIQFARAEGVPESQLEEVPPEGRVVRIGDVEVRFVPSLHGRIALGRVPFPGEVKQPPRLPARAWHYRMGGAFGVHLTTPFGRLYHNGSADLVDAELEGLKAETLLVGLAGRFATRDYLKRLVEALEPELLVPTHHDAFFGPLEAGLRHLPGIDLSGFVSEAHVLAPRAAFVAPTYGDVLHVPRDARAAAFSEWRS